MARPRKCRYILREPGIKRFKPAGIPARDLEEIEVSIDEYEAVRLADLESHSHEEAAAHMGVSRATFGRIVENARRKIADALINGKTIVIDGGDYAKHEDLTGKENESGNDRPKGNGRKRCGKCGRGFINYN